MQHFTRAIQESIRNMGLEFLDALAEIHRGHPSGNSEEELELQ